MITKWAQARSRLRTFNCVTCGKSTTRVVRHNGDAGLCCSRACGFVYRDGKRAKKKAARLALLAAARAGRSFACSVCGTSVKARTKVCSPACRTVKNRLAHPRKSSLSCDMCGMVMVFRPGHTRSRFCSATCRQRHMRTRASFKAGRRVAKQVRRARKRGNVYERVDPILVFARDGWRCQLCGCATPRRLRGTLSDQAPELDHIVPLACGGPHTWANTQCACRRCNQDKGARPLGQQRLSLATSTSC